MGGVEQRPRPHEQQRFEHGMIDRVVEPGEKPQCGKFLQPVGLKDHAGTDAEQNDADVFHAVKRQETLEVVLHERIHHAE